jgi:glycosyltransferase involved in cell wall biosynthesis
VKVLLVCHNFPPEHAAGTETYTAQLGHELARRGHKVHVFTTEKDISQPHLSQRERDYSGLQVHEVFNNLYYDDFGETWDYPPIEALFEERLDRIEPNVVHVHHLMYLSVGCVEAAAQRGIPVVYTLHDYWLHCARFGQRIHADGEICHTVDFDRCGTCLASFKYAQSPLERRLGGAIARLRTLTGVDVGALARDTAQNLKGKKAPPPPAEQVDQTAGARMASLARQRVDDLRERLLPHVNLFLSPSEFLRERFLEQGFPKEAVRVVRTGVDAQAFHSVQRVPRRKRLRVSFVGSLVPAKGPHLLLEAWGRLPQSTRLAATLDLHGPAKHNPEYRRELATKAEQVGARLHGPLTREGVIALLSETDLLVVPSVWYENAPLVILEAIACRTPLLVADLGGMAELVVEGETGYHFRTGDAEDLSAKLIGVIEDPERLDELFAEDRELRGMGDLAKEVEAIYREVIEGGP